MIDDMVRQIVETLKKNKQLDNTIIVFASDNGCAAYIGVKDMEKQGHFPSYIYKGYKSDIYEGGHRIPLIVSWKGKYGKRQTILWFHWLTFMLPLPKCSITIWRRKKPLTVIVCGRYWVRKALPARKDLVHEAGEGICLYTFPQLKLVFYGGSGGWTYPVKPVDVAKFPPMQLFDIVKDPSEKKTSSVTNVMRMRWKRWNGLWRNIWKEGRSTPGESFEWYGE